MARLFEPLTIRSITLPNRLMVSPMCMYSANDGMANEFHFVHLGQFALGGFGLVMVEATAVEPQGRITYGDLGLWSDEHVEPLARIASFLKKHGSIPAIQLAHAGRKASMQRPWEGDGPLGDTQFAQGESPWPVVGPSSIAFNDGWLLPHELSVADLNELKAKYVSAVHRAVKAGFELIEMHAAHGYLLSTFLSPLSNKRDDSYGGSREARFRFPLEIARAMREAWPSHLPMFVRVSAVDYIEGGVTIEDTVEFAKLLKEIDIDVVDCSSGGVSPTGIPPKAYGFQVPFAEQIRREVDIATAAVGLITKPEQAEEILAAGQADLIAIGREALVEPHWPLRARSVLNENGSNRFEKWPVQYQVWLSKRERVIRTLEVVAAD
jgi:2,4-dienoyl-CoA reductase-like NADH-dependent reductase (Old Yellow Enzyme family)